MRFVFLLAVLICATGLPSLSQVTGISDREVNLDEGLDFSFKCPKELALKISSNVDTSSLSDRAKALLAKEAETSSKSQDCYVRFTRDQIDVNGMQVIDRSSVLRHWEVYNYRAYGNITRSWNFLYRVGADETVYLLEVGNFRNFSFGGGQDAEQVNLFFQAWMAGI